VRRRGAITAKAGGGTGGVGRDRDEFADAFETAFARLQAKIESVCVATAPWSKRVAAAIRASLDFAAANPDAAQTLTNDALAQGKEGFARYDRMVEHFCRMLLEGRDEQSQGECLPEITEKMMIGGLATLIAQRLDYGRHVELPSLALEAIQFVLTPYVGIDEAKRIAALSD